MTVPDFDDAPPIEDRVTCYDERHFVTYLRLLDANDENADWREVVRLIFEIDPALDATRAKSVHDSHLARAQWMCTSGYRHLLKPRLQ